MRSVHRAKILGWIVELPIAHLQKSSHRFYSSVAWGVDCSYLTKSVILKKSDSNHINDSNGLPPVTLSYRRIYSNLNLHVLYCSSNFFENRPCFDDK